MTDWAWLGIFSVALLAASLLGSWLPRQIIMTHTRTQMVLSLVSGLMLGVALCHLIPHSFGLVGDIDLVMAWSSRWTCFHAAVVAAISFSSA